MSTFKPEIAAINSTTSASLENAMRLATPQVPPSLPISLQRYNVVKDNMPRFHNDYEYLGGMDLLYHRLDLLPPSSSQTCRFFRQVATMGKFGRPDRKEKCIYICMYNIYTDYYFFRNAHIIPKCLRVHVAVHLFA